MSTESEQVKKKCTPKWSSDDIGTFLEVYTNYELLWNIRHNDYANKAKRENAISLLKNDLIIQGVVVPDLPFLRARIKAIKATYKQELIKVEESKTSGKGVDDIYIPKLPWFSTADAFLRDVAITRKSQSNLILAEQQVVVNNDEQPSENLNTKDAVSDLNIENQLIEEATCLTPCTNSLQEPKSSVKKRRISKLSKVESAISKLQQIAESRPIATKQSTDEYDVFGQHVAGQLRKLPVRSFVVLQEKIQSLITAERLNCMAADSPLSSYMSTPPIFSRTASPDDGGPSAEEAEIDLILSGSLLYKEL